MDEVATPAAPDGSTAIWRGRRTLVLIAAVALAPIVGATLAYYFFPRTAQTNYGKLLAVRPAPEVTGTTLDGKPFALSRLHGRWVLMHAGSGNCAAACARELYATRQARTIQGREQDRVMRAWLITDVATPDPRILQQHPGVIVARVPPGALTALPAGTAGIYLVDPLGNLVLQYPEDPDIKALGNDLGRLLRASSIG